jgi:hypothetical protein
MTSCKYAGMLSRNHLAVDTAATCQADVLVESQGDLRVRNRAHLQASSTFPPAWTVY